MPGVVVIGAVANYKRGKGLEMMLQAFADVVRDVAASRAPSSGSC